MSTPFSFTAFRLVRIVIFLVLSGSSIASLAQDPEYADFRRKSESFARIYEKDIRSDLASFAIGGLDESIGKAPLKKIPVSKFGNDFITFDSNNVQITIRAGVFDPTKHKLAYDGKFLVKIDGKPYFGNYSKIPKTTIKEVTIVIGKDTVQVPATALFDLYNPSFTYKDGSGVVRSQDAVYLSGDKHTMYVYMLNKDDTGSYEVTWIIQDKKYVRRVLDYGFFK